MSSAAEVRFVSFGRHGFRERECATYERVILHSRTDSRMSPFAPELFAELRGAEIIHCYQYYTLPTFLAALYGRMRSRKVFVSDLGGGGWTPAYYIDQSRWITATLPISQYAAAMTPAPRKLPHVTIYGGVDLNRYPMREKLEHDGSVVFLGRVLPHKGVHFLLSGIPHDMPLKVVGPVGDQDYYRRLHAIAQGKQVQFIGAASDAEVRDMLRRAMVLVHPTPVDETGSAGANELFGLAVVEAMASGCVPVVSNVASLPEIVEDGSSGLLVPPNDPDGIATQLRRLKQETALWRELALGARQRVEATFTWGHVVERCLRAYELA